MAATVTAGDEDLGRELDRDRLDAVERELQGVGVRLTSIEERLDEGFARVLGVWEGAGRRTERCMEIAASTVERLATTAVTLAEPRRLALYAVILGVVMGGWTAAEVVDEVLNQMDIPEAVVVEPDTDTR